LNQPRSFFSEAPPAEGLLDKASSIFRTGFRAHWSGGLRRRGEGLEDLFPSLEPRRSWSEIVIAALTDPSGTPVGFERGPIRAGMAEGIITFSEKEERSRE